MGTCTKCGASMVPMIMSSFCPNDCDRPAAPAVDRRDMPWMKYDTGHSIAVKGEEGGSYYAHYYTIRDITIDAPMPVSTKPLRGWWIGEYDGPDVPTVLALMTKYANSGDAPGWSFNGTQTTGQYIRSNINSGNLGPNILGALIFAWVEE